MADEPHEQTSEQTLRPGQKPGKAWRGTFTPERRAALRQRMLEVQPWKLAQGPVTAAGKIKSRGPVGPGSRGGTSTVLRAITRARVRLMERIEQLDREFEEIRVRERRLER